MLTDNNLIYGFLGDTAYAFFGLPVSDITTFSQCLGSNRFFVFANGNYKQILALQNTTISNESKECRL
jgi:hypothetical protein